MALRLMGIALFLLAACGGAASTGQLAEQPAANSTMPTGAPSQTSMTPTHSPEPTQPKSDPTAGSKPEATVAEPTATQGQAETSYEIITLLPFDAIPSIDAPVFYDAEEADDEYDPGELVLGVEMGGEARAYSVSLLSRHEIVNDSISGHPIAVTW
jgi:hypothetical protein